MIRKMLLISLTALITISPADYRLWSLEETIKPADLKTLTVWQALPDDGLTDFTFGNEGDCLIQNPESILIQDCANPQSEPKWQSAASWQVKEAVIADLNRDGWTELVMVVWRPFKPWPIDSFMPHGGRIDDFHDRRGQSCHLILVGWDGEVYRELWAGSALIDPVFNIRAVDLDGDGLQELAALEGQYDATRQTGSLTVWDWNGFGFRLRDRVVGSFNDFGIIWMDNNVLIVTNFGQEEK